MGDRRIRLVLPLLALAVSACAKSDPSGATSVYLTIDNGPGLAVPDELRVTALGDDGSLFEDQRLPAAGPLVAPAGGGSLLGTVTLYVGAGITRISVDVSGDSGGVMLSEGMVSVGVVAGKQVSAKVVLAAAVGGGADGAVDSSSGPDEAAADALADDGAPADGGAAPPDAAEADAPVDNGAAPDGDAARPDAAGTDAPVEDGASPDGGAALPDGGAVRPDAATGADAPVADAGADARCSGSSLAGVMAVPVSPVDLTAEGTLDWRHWGLNGGVDFKVTAGNLISDYTLIGNGTTSSPTRSALTFNWSDGSPRLNVTGAYSAIAVAGVGSGFEITVPAAASARTLAVYVSGENDTGSFTASLSDGCAADYTMTSSSTQIFVEVHRLSFRSAVPGTLLRVRWTMTAGVGAVGLHAATLY